MPRFSKKKTIRLSYQLDENAFQKLEKLLKELNEPNEEKSILYTVYLKNDDAISDLSLAELLDLPNVHHSIIDSITVSTGIFDNNSIIIMFNNNEFIPIEYRLHTENERDLVYFQKKIEDFSQSLKKTYSGVATSPLLAFIFLFTPISFILVRILNRIFSSIDIIQKGWPNGVVFFILGCLVSWLVATHKNKIFPVGDFRIGNGIERSNHKKWIRNGVLVTFALGVAESIISFFLTN